MTRPAPPVAGVIGWPVAHSKSPLIHRFWLSALGLDGDYVRLPVAPDDLGAAIRALPALGFRGVNVTVPHKQAVLAHLHRLDTVAERVGAVNVIVVEDGELVGYNSDVDGIRDALANVAERPLPINHVATLFDVIGAGGAARAAGVALPGDTTFYNRTRARADELADLFSGGAAYGFSATLDDLPKRRFVFDPRYPAVRENRGTDQRYSYVVVNASTLGMVGQPSVPIDLRSYPEDTIVFDMVYAPLETPLLAQARDLGLRTVDGLAMLIGQAAAAFEMFFGAPAPRGRDAELRALLTE